MSYELEYPFRISEIAGRSNDNEFRDMQKAKRDKELNQLKVDKSKLFRLHYKKKVSFEDLAVIYHVSTYRMAQFFRINKPKKGGK